MEDFLETHKNAEGEPYDIYVAKQFEPRVGDKIGLFFRVIPQKEKDDYWWGTVYVSNTLKKQWGVKNIRETLLQVGTLIIKRKIEMKEEDNFEIILTTKNSSKTKNKTLEFLDKKVIRNAKS